MGAVMRHLPSLFAAAVLTAATWVPTAHAVDLTGTWTGQQVCKAFNGSSAIFKTKPSEMLISQTGHSLTVRVDGLSGYKGRVVDDAKKPDDKGQVSVILCGTDDNPGSVAPGEILIAKVKANPIKGTGALGGASSFESAANVGTCKWVYKRTNAADPAAVACP
jgi:hypothetical protein